MDIEISDTDLQENLDAFIDEVSAFNQPFGITRDGETKVCVVPIKLVEQLQSKNWELIMMMLELKPMDAALNQEMHDFVQELIDAGRAGDRWKEKLKMNTESSLESITAAQPVFANSVESHHGE